MTMANSLQNPLKETLKLGQSIWYDGLIAREEFERMILQDGLRGATTNPVIFEKAIASGQTDRFMKGSGPGVTEDEISGALYTAELPDPDLVIRTSGEMRLSNFLMWQLAYAELYVTPIFWPDFRRAHLLEAVADFQRRERRFGGL